MAKRKKINTKSPPPKSQRQANCRFSGRSKEMATTPAPTMHPSRGNGSSTRNADTVNEVTAGSNSLKKGIFSTNPLITVTLMRERSYPALQHLQLMDGLDRILGREDEISGHQDICPGIHQPFAGLKVHSAVDFDKRMGPLSGNKLLQGC